MSTEAPMKEAILRFRVSDKVAQRLEAEASRLGLRVAEVARFRLSEAVMSGEGANDTPHTVDSDD